MKLDGHQVAGMNDASQIDHLHEPHDFGQEVLFSGGPKIRKIDFGSWHQ
jgi:hypothetical protein